MTATTSLILKTFLSQNFTPRQASEKLRLTLDDSIQAIREGGRAGCFILIDALVKPEHRERGGSLWWANPSFPEVQNVRN